MAGIKISELSIGDWVEIDGAATKVWYLSQDSEVNDTTYDWVKPIPLTPEILEKNGWSKKYDDVWEYGVWRISQIDKCLFVLYNEKYDYDFCVYIDTVHQLQHALRLAGVGKEIVL